MGSALLPFDKRGKDSADLRKGLIEQLKGLPAATVVGSDGPQRSGKSEAIASTRAVGELRTGLTTRSTPVEQLANATLAERYSRQVLRALGFSEIRRQCRIKFPNYTRREINQLAKELHERAWKKRDRAAIARLKRG